MVEVRSKIVLIAYGGGHVNMLIPIIKKLQKKQGLELVVLGLTTAGFVLERNNIPYIGFKDLLDADNFYARRWGEKLVNKDDLHNLVSYEESIAYMGLSYVDLEKSYGKEKAAEIYANYGRQSFNPVRIMDSFLRKEAPDLLVATNSPRAERAAIRAAMDIGIASICLVDLFALSEVEWIGLPKYATKVCVLSESVKNFFVKYGRLESEIVVTGNPVFDTLKKYKDKRSLYRKKYSLDGFQKVILWASQIEPESHPFTNKKGDPLFPRKIEQTLIDIATRNPLFKIIFRPHPNEKVQHRGLPNNILVSGRHDNLYELLSAVDVVITMTSTVGLEAVILGKRLITIDRSIFTEDAPYSKMGLSYGINQLEDIESAIKDKKSYASINIPSNATDNVLSVIGQLL